MAFECELASEECTLRNANKTEHHDSFTESTLTQTAKRFFCGQFLSFSFITHTYKKKIYMNERKEKGCAAKKQIQISYKISSDTNTHTQKKKLL
mmetsp:Transcript_32364/g.37374  ORF Transcript_32364/g.37374 Transcript_32364/m.37374 type:complete len:94 (+) Transcript_32364:1704-1985(+)